jgi:hypothetical protein
MIHNGATTFRHDNLTVTNIFFASRHHRRHGILPEYPHRVFTATVYNTTMKGSSETLVGSIERVTYHIADNGFGVLKIVVKGHNNLVTLVGHLAFAVPGEYVEAEGRWIVDRDHGQQFKADSIRGDPNSATHHFCEEAG